MDIMMQLLTKRFNDIGLLVLRLGIGVIFIGHGAPKILGGPERWEQVGMAMTSVGIDFMPVFWGFMASCAEFFGAICLILGLLFRPATVLMAITMIVATAMHVSRGDGFTVASHAMKGIVIFVSLSIIGPGKYALDERLMAHFDRKRESS
jgi:putative oxidoreductase